MITVSGLSVTPVKGLGLEERDEVLLGPVGVAENRRFHLVDRLGFLFSGIDHGPLCLVRPTYDAGREQLALSFPNGTTVQGSALAGGTAADTDVYGRRVPGRIVEGPFADALSEYVGQPLRLVRADARAHACDVHPITFLSSASVEELARRSGHDAPIDRRRFRMLVALDGCRAHEEDEWEGAAADVGQARVRIGGPVARCATTTRDPATGRRDLDTLRLISAYRGRRDGKHIDFGVYGDVERPGRVRVGDAVMVEREG